MKHFFNFQVYGGTLPSSPPPLRKILRDDKMRGGIKNGGMAFFYKEILHFNSCLVVHLRAFLTFLQDPMKSELLYSFKFMFPFKFHALFLMRKLKGSNLRTGCVKIKGAWISVSCVQKFKGAKIEGIQINSFCGRIYNVRPGNHIIRVWRCDRFWVQF